MRARYTSPQPQVKSYGKANVQQTFPSTYENQGRITHLLHYKLWLLPGIILLGAVLLVILSGENPLGSRMSSVRQSFAERTFFREYSFPLQNNEAMRPAIDHQGRIWFGAMGQNALVVFDPQIRTFRYLTPPRGHHGIMGVVVAPDDTIWFAEQYANYLAHYFPSTGHYEMYPLPLIRVLDQGHTGHQLSLPSAPNELALDAKGDVWFTEFNADRLGRLDPQTGQMQHYLLSSKPSVQVLYPYGVAVDRKGSVWFTESGSNKFGQLEPETGAVHLFAVPNPLAPTMEIASDDQDSLWITSFTPGLLFRYQPHTGRFTSYTVSMKGNERGALYGLLIQTPEDVWVTILTANVVAHLDVKTGRFLYYRIPTPGSLPLGLVIDSNQNIWYTGFDKLGMLHPAKS